MSKVLSLKLRENIFEETENILHKIHKARNSYINDAVEFYNKLFKRRMLKSRFAKESKLVAGDSLTILEEFEAFEENE